MESFDAPLFQCPTCGYQCPDTWESNPDAVCRATWYFAGRIVMAMMLTLPLHIVCVHPDGTGASGGARTFRLPSTTTRNLITPKYVIREDQRHSSTAVWLSSLLRGQSIRNPSPYASLILVHLAGPIAESVLSEVMPERYPQEFLRAYELLPTGQVRQEAELQSYQEAVLELLWPVFHVVEGFADALDEHHGMTEAEASALYDSVVLSSALYAANVGYFVDEVEKDGEVHPIEGLGSGDDEDPESGDNEEEDDPS